jgi:hypothetical protein
MGRRSDIAVLGMLDVGKGERHVYNSSIPRLHNYVVAISQTNYSLYRRCLIYSLCRVTLGLNNVLNSFYVRQPPGIYYNRLNSFPIRSTQTQPALYQRIKLASQTVPPSTFCSAVLPIHFPSDSYKNVLFTVQADMSVQGRVLSFIYL